MRLIVLSLVGVSAVAHGQVEQFLNTPRFAWGAGSGLPAPYTQADMNITMEFRVVTTWVPYTSTGGLQEVVLTKAPGSANFNIPISSITTLFTSSQPIVWSSAVSGQQVTWTTNQVFSQPGGYVISGSFDNGGTPVSVNLTVNNVAVTGSLRSNFAGSPPAMITTLGRVANVRGTHTGGDAVNFIDMDTGTASGTVAGLPVNDVKVHFRNIQHINHPPMPYRLNCTANLGDVANNGPYTAKIDILPASGPGPVEWSWTGPITQSTAFDLSVFGFDPVPIAAAANRRVRIRVGSHLSQTLPITLWENPAVVGFNLINGDVDGSEEVDAADIDATILYFGTDGFGLPVHPDVDNSGEVDASDIDIVIANFGQTGS
ncbi:MAG: hypothetical protein IT205_01555 [Fimbriimonadaceae bacterium]|nr:hypothetical protein [Fimbriimonadaceae bacterium]